MSQYTVEEVTRLEDLDSIVNVIWAAMDGVDASHQIFFPVFAPKPADREAAPKTEFGMTTKATLQATGYSYGTSPLDRFWVDGNGVPTPRTHSRTARRRLKLCNILKAKDGASPLKWSSSATLYTKNDLDGPATRE